MNFRANFLNMLILICAQPLIFSNLNFGFFSPTDIKGMAVEYNSKLYTLNFEQQNEVMQILHGLDLYPRNESSVDKNAFDYTRLIIYRFEEPDLEVIPIRQEQEGIIFELRQKNGSTKEVKTWNLHALLSQTFEK